MAWLCHLVSTLNPVHPGDLLVSSMNSHSGPLEACSSKSNILLGSRASEKLNRGWLSLPQAVYAALTAQAPSQHPVPVSQAQLEALLRFLHPLSPSLPRDLQRPYLCPTLLLGVFPNFLPQVSQGPSLSVTPPFSERPPPKDIGNSTRLLTIVLSWAF